jgi:hypothetical protein
MKRSVQRETRELSPAMIATLSKMRARGRLWLEELNPQTKVAVMEYDARVKPKA